LAISAAGRHYTTKKGRFDDQVERQLKRVAAQPA
jgi:hypothetical protein